MRIAVRQPPEGRWVVSELPEHSSYAVYLDGAKLEDVFAADDEAGELWRSKRGPDGEILIDQERQEVVAERLTGSVQIVQVPR